METDEDGWRDLNERLDELALSARAQEVLLDYLAGRLVGHFGTDAVECHLGKSDPRQHSMKEVAAAALAHLVPILNELPTGAIPALIESGKVGTPMPAPWDDTWRTEPRTAGWRA